jgi:Domain of unknown function (DUF4440)
MKRLPHFFLLVLLSLCVVGKGAQSAAQPDPLFTTIQSLDTKLFDAYNHCDLTTLGTLEVYPLKGYGAVEIGIHRFHHPENAENVGDAKFVMLWQNKDGMWKVTRVISYNHNHGLLAK